MIVILEYYFAELLPILDVGEAIVVGDAMLYTRDSNDTMLTENILDLSGNIIASKRFDNDDDPSTPNEWEGQYFFYHYDIRGSVTAIVDPNGDPVKQYTYDEFGNLEETGESTFDNEVTFTSSVTDKSTGLQYMNSRFYNPTTGRFLSQDTFSGNAYEPWTQHLYSYCGNNPVNMVDPTGHESRVTYVDGNGVSQTVIVPNPEQGDKKFKPYDIRDKNPKRRADRERREAEKKANEEKEQTPWRYVPDTLPGDYPVEINWEEYVNFDAPPNNGSDSNINPEFLGRLAYMVKTEEIEMLQVGSGYRTNEKQASYTGDLAASPGTSWHEYGLAVDCKLSWRFLKDLPKSALVEYGLCRWVTSDSGVYEWWHIDPIEVYPGGKKVHGKDRKEWAKNNAYYEGIEIGWP